MNKQLLIDYLPFEVKPEQISESIKENDGKLIKKIETNGQSRQE